nr:hypothetical protein CFP56_50382 [Quercus suber]
MLAARRRRSAFQLLPLKLQRSNISKGLAESVTQGSLDEKYCPIEKHCLSENPECTHKHRHDGQFWVANEAWTGQAAFVGGKADTYLDYHESALWHDAI